METRNAKTLVEGMSLDNIVNAKAVDVMKAYLDGNEYAYGVTIMELSTILAHRFINSTLKGWWDGEKHTFKDGTYNQTLWTLKNDITIASRWAILVETLGTLYAVRYDKKGNAKTVCTDSKRAFKIMQELEKIAGCIGNDLTAEAYTVICKYIAEAEEHSPTFLIEPFTVYDKRTMRYSDGSLKPEKLWKTLETNVIREAIKAISRYVNAQRKITESTTLYAQITTTTADGETIERIKKASPLSAYTVTDINGRVSAIVANDESEERLRSIPAKANLNERQRYVFVSRYIKNMTVLQIAESLNFDNNGEQRVKNILTDIHNKIVKANIFTQYTDEDRRVKTTSSAVYCYRAGDAEKTVVYTFESIGRASQVLCIDKGNISKVLNGKRASIGGLVFKRLAEV